MDTTKSRTPMHNSFTPGCGCEYCSALRVELLKGVPTFSFTHPECGEITHKPDDGDVLHKIIMMRFMGIHIPKTLDGIVTIPPDQAIEEIQERMKRE